MAELIDLPAQLHAGDTLQRTLYLAGYEPGDGWQAVLTIADSAASHDIESSPGGANNASHVLDINTGTLAAGSYRYGLVVKNGTDRLTLQAGRLQILPNFADGAGDHRSHCEKVLEAIEALLEGKAGKDVAKLTVDGQNLERYPIPDLLVLRDKYRAELAVLIRRQKGWKDRPVKKFRL